MIRILIVDDRAQVRLGLQMRLAAEPDMTVAGAVPDGSSALLLVEAVSPDVVLMDVEMPLYDGIETCIALHRRYPDLPVVFLTIYDDACTRARAAHAHAAGFVSKDRSVDSLLAAIRQAAGTANDGTGPQP
jgi:DNA-binding NarL/FixJ family response regulator